MTDFKNVSVKEIRDFYVTLIKSKIDDIKKSTKSQLLEEISQNPDLLEGLKEWCKDEPSSDEHKSEPKPDVPMTENAPKPKPRAKKVLVANE
jgi:hypothetical protein